MKTIAAIAAFLLIFSPANTQTVDWSSAWGKYNADTHRLCPSQKLEDLSDGQYDDVLDGFLPAYPAAVRSRISTIVNYPKTCAAETAGFSCEFGAHLRSFQRIGLRHAFVAYSCRHWRCEEATLCKQLAPQR
ncbi:hypothetical protein [Granulicella tundricola]|uniref:Uncharacterized protein n=1 Tax=Granulicella tundricola (strain ATCC BAA-1859 / DSM 23138 / MP5ACTX9) TaxID=1198114 RepID=E8X7W5_GRATM|nr:hypothetical protein [Granulicella tundricola]ADW71549.1 hypothetical protein AciX9_4619 [Granulicella tundricola MP5ACTX9]